jgi:hypothetical protein
VVESYTFTGRTPKPWYKKLNPIWWVQNDDEQNLDSGGAGGGAPPDYMLGEPQWKRRLFWEFRNPFQHLRCYVLGVQDRNYTVTGRAPVLTTQRGAADAVIFVDFGDFTAHSAGNLAKLTLLIGRGLVDGADAKVENSALHDKSPL